MEGRVDNSAAGFNKVFRAVGDMFRRAHENNEGVKVTRTEARFEAVGKQRMPEREERRREEKVEPGQLELAERIQDDVGESVGKKRIV